MLPLRYNHTESVVIVLSRKPRSTVFPETSRQEVEESQNDIFKKITIPVGAAIVGVDLVEARMSPAIINTSRSFVSNIRTLGKARHPLPCLAGMWDPSHAP
jgi:hypothetical protein